MNGYFYLLMSEPRIFELLDKYWGYSSFREKQEEIIHCVLERKDTLALLPTGGGKSICFQIPALYREGICIVISPLVALMQDQVETLNRKGIKAIYIHSAMPKRQIDIALDNAAYGDFKFLYVSPERIETSLFQERLKKMNVSMIAVDEAHCISQWGYDFRPSYLKINQLRNFVKEAPLIALTASATKKVVEDIQEKLEFRKPNVIQKSFYRENLSYVVRETEDILNELSKVIKGVGGSGIVYANQRKRSEEIAKLLKSQGYNADFYHAGLDFASRKKKQENWINDSSGIMVATNAFGMGIDKSNVRFVVHIDLPSSIEAYYQEAGRAGRDGKRAYAVALYNKASLQRLKDSIEQKYPSKKEIILVYNALCNFLQIPLQGGEGQTFEIELNEFCNRYSFQRSKVTHSLELLSRELLIDWKFSSYSPSSAMIEAKQKDLYTFQLSHPIYDALISALLRLYGGIYESYVTIDEALVGKMISKPKKWVIEKLEQLQKMDLIAYKTQSSQPKINFLKGRFDAKQIRLSKENYLDRKKKDTVDVKSVISYMTQNGNCRSKQLMRYFGDDSGINCRICDQCISRKKRTIDVNKFKHIKNEIINALGDNKLSLKRLFSILSGLKEEDVIEVLRFMMDNDEIQFKQSKYSVTKKKGT